MRHKRVIPILLLILGVGGLLAYRMCGAVLDRVKVEECASNLKNIAASLVDYTNAHEGQYPDQIEQILDKDLAGEIFVCVATHETPGRGTREQKQAEIAAGRHYSYIYVGSGLKTDCASNVVLMYEPLTNHHGRGMNVLFADYHIEFLDAKSAEAMLNSRVPGKPMTWGTSSEPRTSTTQQ